MGVGVADTRISVPLPKQVDRQLREYAHQQQRPVAGLVRFWITEKLAQAHEKRGSPIAADLADSRY